MNITGAYYAQSPHGQQTEQEAQLLLKAFFPDDSEDVLLNVELNIDKISADVRRGDFNACAGEAIASGEPYACYKRAMARVVYRALSQAKGNALPWGTLLGVRPVKLAYDILQKGGDQKAIARFLADEYYCSDAKADLAYRVAAKERHILQAIDRENGYSVYIGIPFCPSTCDYCSFASYPTTRFADCVEPYLDALEREIDGCAGLFRDRMLQAVYIGGGTPTTLSARNLERLCGIIHRAFATQGLLEFTVEAGRPDTFSPDKLRVLREQGVTRICVNPQTMVDRTLARIGRAHDASQTVSAFEMARESGFDQINMDLIIGLPYETNADFAYTLAQVGRLGPDSLTVHCLAKKRAASIVTKHMSYDSADVYETERMYADSTLFAQEHGYEPYYLYRQKNVTGNLENVGYAKQGKECYYNILIMEEKHDILAFGAGASSKFIHKDSGRIGRVENVKSLHDYIDRVDEMVARKKDYFSQGRTRCK